MYNFKSLKPELGFVIGETACGHEGNIEKLKQLIDCIVEARAQAVKFQIFTPLERVTPEHHEWEIFNKLTLSENNWKEAVSYARENRLIIFADVFGDEGFNIAKNLDVDGYKVHSEDLLNSNFIANVAAENKIVMIGVGGAHRIEIYNLLNFLEQKKLLNNIILMTGVQTFPTPVEAHSLDEVSDLNEKYSSANVKIGFSDHVAGELTNEAMVIPLMALSKGASVIEKHVTIDRRQKWEDYESALDKTHFIRFLELVRTMSPLLKPVGTLNSYEKQYRKTFKKSPVPKQDLIKNKILDDTNFEFVKHAKHSVPLSALNILGKTLTRGVKSGEVIRMSGIQNKVGAVIVARCSSSRLPSKATRVIQGRETIALLIERIKRCKNVDVVILATSTDSSDDILEEIAKREGVSVFRGSLEDLSSRFYEAAKHYELSQIVRITGDDILRDEVMIDKAIKDHLHNSCDVTFTKNMPYGTSSEVFTLNALETIMNTATVPSNTEYLEWFLKNDRYFSVNQVESGYSYDSSIRLTLDYDEDFELFSKIYEHFYPANPNFTLVDTLKFLESHPEVIAINQNKKAKYTSNDIDVSLKI